jgi:hypothetical protein
VFKVRRWRLNIKIRERPFAEGSRDLTCARAFICKTKIKICFERWLFHVNDWQWVLAIFHTKQVRAVSSSLKIGTLVLFYKAWHSSPLFLSQTMANRFHRVPTNFHIPWRSAFFLFFS